MFSIGKCHSVSSHPLPHRVSMYGLTPSADAKETSSVFVLK